MAEVFKLSSIAGFHGYVVGQRAAAKLAKDMVMDRKLTVYMSSYTIKTMSKMKLIEACLNRAGFSETDRQVGKFVLGKPGRNGRQRVQFAPWKE